MRDLFTEVLMQFLEICGNLVSCICVRTHRWGYWCSSGFRRWLQLVCCTYLLTLSEYFGVSRTFGVWVKSDTSLRSGGGNEARQGSAYRWLKSCRWGKKLLK